MLTSVVSIHLPISRLILESTETSNQGREVPGKGHISGNKTSLHIRDGLEGLKFHTISSVYPSLMWCDMTSHKLIEA
jgi:hypothetical protein